MNDNSLLPEVTEKKDQPDDEELKDNSIPRIEIGEPLAQKKEHSGMLFLAAFFCLTATVTASCLLRFGDMLENEYRPAGYELKNEAATISFSRLNILNKLLPSSKPYFETDTDSSDKTAEFQDEIPEGHLKIVEYDFSGTGLANETDYKPDLEKLANLPLTIENTLSVMSSSSASLPQVLIIHTHGSEAYTPEGDISYPSDSGMRSYDITQNVVAVGSVVADRLKSAGIGVIHLTEMFDSESYYNSYNRSLEAVKSCLAQNETINYVIDIHRDAAADTKRGIAYKPVTEINGEKCAQLMLVVGTDFLGANHPDWQENLGTAAKLVKLLSDISPSLVRPINLRGASFNQQYSPGSLLLEVGSCSNTLEEAKLAGEYFADCLVKLIHGNY